LGIGRSLSEVLVLRPIAISLSGFQF